MSLDKDIRTAQVHMHTGEAFSKQKAVLDELYLSKYLSKVFVKT